MIRFFRQIRQRLLTDNKFSKYLLYAIGELLLVVIGILIALQVDTWSKKKEEDLKAQKILVALQNEFEKNKTELIQAKTFNNRVIFASNSLLDIIADFPDNYNEIHLDSLLRDYGYFWSFDPYNGALETAVSSGDIHLIENESLINLLFAWPSMILDSKEEETEAKQLLFEQKRDLLFRYIREVDIWKQGRSPFDSDYVGLFKDPDFENNIEFRRGVMIELVREQNAILEANESILSLIEKEIN